MSGSLTPALLEICQPQEADVVVARDYYYAKWTTSNLIVNRMSNQLKHQQEQVEKYKRRCVDLRKKLEEFEQTIEELEANLEESYQVINNLKQELKGIVYKNEFIDQKQNNETNVRLFNKAICPHCNKKLFQ